MPLCSLSVAYACTYHNPTDTMGHSVHNVDISKPLSHTMPYMLSAICLVKLKPGVIREEHTSPACQWPSKKPDVEVLGLRGYTWSAIVRPAGHTQNSLKHCWGGLWQRNEQSIILQQLWWTFLQSACQLYAPSKLMWHCVV